MGFWYSNDNSQGALLEAPNVSSRTGFSSGHSSLVAGHFTGRSDLSDFEAGLLEQHKRRTPIEVAASIRRLLDKKFDQIDAIFRKMPEYNSMVMTRESLYQLLKRLAHLCFHSMFPLGR